MATIGQLISDIELRVTKGNVSDDFPIDRRQIRFWLDTERARLIEEKQRAQGMQELADFVILYECQPIEEKDIKCGDGCNGKRYEVNLPVSVLELKNDLGVYRVETVSGNTIHRIRLSEKARIYKLKFAQPSNSRAVYWRIGDTLTIEGGTDNFKKNGMVHLYLVPEDTSGLSEDEEYPIDASIIPIMLQRVEEIARRELGTPEDIENDGKQQ